MAENSPIRSLLFVCMGNICRSPAAENMMVKKLRESGLADVVQVDSAGTIGYHAGSPPDERMTAAGKRRGLPMTGRARQVKVADFKAFDLIIGMDEANLADLRRLSPEGKDKVRSFCSYCRKHDDREVPDPYYGGKDGFEHVLDLLEDGCEQILAEIRDHLSRSSEPEPRPPSS